ncbi:chemotaxis protein CheZ [Celerinatantimonas diazotrophica]|uniref:Protein phosphatase CheZ n=1 Tax=Celerinatantimonas diazotrophica TaxID=412034 RepID=A0A4R1JM38_9GAMM|nr:protein phosphatase CheZ [Celerinatantimonas diazotrophica]TCK52116.1 chemotaxis protein CheZ [Celerinatantimonas diazotrophica]CAG9296179.1 Protein phosphatase CheZ [Celerinatantimonas diazotrophica]
MTNEAPLISLDQAKQLVAFLEQGDATQANLIVTQACATNSDELFKRVGELTRELHNSLNDFNVNMRISEIASHEMPDARERLSYVIDMTNNAANKTMDAVEASLPLADRLNDQIANVMPSWRNLMERNLSLGEFKTLCHQLDEFLYNSAIDADKLRQMLTDILMAQDFQDLTGQMITKVIVLVQEVEGRLVEMLTLFGGAASKEPTSVQKTGIEAEGPIHNKEAREDVVQSQDDVDDLLSSLGF